MLEFKKVFLFLFVFFLSFGLYSQNTTYKVVCDKKDNQVKVVESSNHSPDLIPLKAGFPYSAVARNWAQKNYPSGTCDPKKILNGIKKEDQPQSGLTNQTNNQPPGQQNNTLTANQTPSPTKIRKKYKNTSIAAMLLIHNMDKVLGVEEANMGSSFAIEHLFGQKGYYVGTGAHFNVYSLKHGGEKFDTYLFKFPVFAGYRISPGNFIVSFDAGIFISTKLSFFDEEYERFLRDDLAKSPSFSFFPRIRIGTPGFQLEAGAQFGLSDVIENREKLTVYFVGLRFCF